jgi:plasmid stabilization system protein ParE
VARGRAQSTLFDSAMTWHASTRPAADGDISEARDWYERQRPGLGDEFLAAVAEVFLRLEAAPEQFPIYYRGFRRALTERFPYKIFFRIEGDAVIVFRVLHAARDHMWRLQ